MKCQLRKFSTQKRKWFSQQIALIFSLNVQREKRCSLLESKVILSNEKVGQLNKMCQPNYCWGLIHKKDNKFGSKATITWCHERWWNRQTTDRELDIFRIELVYHKITTELRHRWKRIVQRCDITKWSWKNLQFQTTNKALSQTTDDYYMVSGKMLYVAFCQVGFPRMNLKSSSVEHDVAKNKEEKENTTRLNVTW